MLQTVMMTLHHHLRPSLIPRQRLLRLQNQALRLIQTLNLAIIILRMRITNTDEEVIQTVRGEEGGEDHEVRILEEEWDRQGAWETTRF